MILVSNQCGKISVRLHDTWCVIEDTKGLYDVDDEKEEGDEYLMDSPRLIKVLTIVKATIGRTTISLEDSEDDQKRATTRGL